jgi:hypothetical protein
MAHSAASDTSPSPGVYARTLLTAAIGGLTYLGFFQYKNAGFDRPTALDDRLHGLADAPDQYRMGVYLAAHAMSARLHIAPTMALAVLGAVAALAALLLLLRVLERSAVYAQAEPPQQWLGATAFVLLILWTLPWALLPEKPETLPAAACLAALVWLWQPQLQSQPASRLSPLAPRIAARIFAIFAISLTLATFRADVACLFHLGILAYVLAVRGPSLSLPRGVAAVTAGLAAAAAAAAQLWLARFAYPQAGYGRVKLWQLRPNLIHGTRWPPFVVFLLPLVWLLLRGLRSGFVRDHIGRAVLTAAMLYSALWITIGKIDEVRIFLPFAWALAPLTAQTLIERSRSPARQTLSTPAGQNKS